MDYQYTTSPGTAGSAIADIHVIVRRSKAASNRRIEAIIELIETMSFTYGSDGKTFSGTFHARRLASTMRLHQMKPPSVEAKSTWGIVGGVE